MLVKNEAVWWRNFLLLVLPWENMSCSLNGHKLVSWLSWFHYQLGSWKYYFTQIWLANSELCGKTSKLKSCKLQKNQISWQDPYSCWMFSSISLFVIIFDLSPTWIYMSKRWTKCRQQKLKFQNVIYVLMYWGIPGRTFFSNNITADWSIRTDCRHVYTILEKLKTGTKTLCLSL